MKMIVTKNQVFEDYYFDEKNYNVISTKGGGAQVVEKLKDRRSPTWKLFINGVPYLVTLKEIVEFTLRDKPSTAFPPQ